jgi:hypothetical protein
LERTYTNKYTKLPNIDDKKTFAVPSKRKHSLSRRQSNVKITAVRVFA